MRTILSVAALACVLSAGCSLPGEKVQCGWYAGIIKPPVINTEMPVLVQQQQGLMGASPLGSVSGPVSEGQFIHSATTPVMPQPIPMQSRLKMIATPQYDPCPPGTRLTAEEWLKIADQAGRQKMPNGAAHQ
jgi:hypothetical protein